MLPEFGHIFLIAGVTLSCVVAFLGGLSWNLAPSWFFSHVTPRLDRAVLSIFILLMFSFCFLTIAFYLDDFSVLYVAQHSNSALPTPFKIAAVWGGHEGSFLFILWALCAWAALLALRGKALPCGFKSVSLLILCALIALLGLYCLWLSNPFLRQIPAPLEGRDLNPMLQDIGLIFHPPLLYLGYIGFAVPFSFAVAALITQSPPSVWVFYSRLWTGPAWGCLSGGIALGAWWAYKELGWGGWWFWDPVENASLLPWLSATALLHCQIATQRNALINWTLLLSLFTFSLTLLGTFIVRSGVLTSVHAFAAAPSRTQGLFGILALVSFGSLWLFAFKAPALLKDEEQEISVKNPVFFFLCGSALLVCMTFVVLIGTFYPLFYASLGKGTLSVGAPYFNALFTPLALGVALLAGIATLRDKMPPARMIFCALALFLASALLTFSFSERYKGDFSFVVMGCLFVCFYLVVGAFCGGLKKQKAPMIFGHLGLACVIMSAAVLSQYSDEISVRMQEEDVVTLGPYQITHLKRRWHIGPNYSAEQILFSVLKDDGSLKELVAEKRHYAVRNRQMSEAGIAQDGFSDIYVTLGTKLDRQTHAVRMQFKPLMGLLWTGGGLMMLSGLLIATHATRRFHQNKKKRRKTAC